MVVDKLDNVIQYTLDLNTFHSLIAIYTLDKVLLSLSTTASKITLKFGRVASYFCQKFLLVREHIPMTSKWVTNDARVVIKNVIERRNDFPSLSPWRPTAHQRVWGLWVRDCFGGAGWGFIHWIKLPSQLSSQTARLRTTRTELS